MGRETEGLICYFCSLDSSDCRCVGGVDQKVLFRSGCFPGLVKDVGRRVGPRFHLLVSDVY